MIVIAIKIIMAIVLAVLVTTVAFAFMKIHNSEKRKNLLIMMRGIILAKNTINMMTILLTNMGKENLEKTKELFKMVNEACKQNDTRLKELEDEYTKLGK